MINTPTATAGQNARSVTSIWSPASLCEKESADNVSSNIDSACEDGPEPSKSTNRTPQPSTDGIKEEEHDNNSDGGSASINNINDTEHRYRINYRRKSGDTGIQKFEHIKNEVEFSLTQAAVAASAAAAAAATANPNFFHFHKQEFDLMAKNHLDLFNINNNNETDGPKISRDERKREQRCFQVSQYYILK